jgi:hypothetical protein
MKYLWVDALGIIQGIDKQAVADWKRESARMEDCVWQCPWSTYQKQND